MAVDNSDEILNTLRELLRAIRNGSIAGSGFYGDKKKTHKEIINNANKDPVKAAADRLRIEVAMKEGTKAIKEATKQQTINNNDMKVAGALFQNAVSKLSLKSFDELPKRINELTKDYAFNFQSTSDVQKALNKYTQENIEELKALHAEYVSGTVTQERMNEISDKLTKTWGDWHSVAVKSQRQLEEEALALKRAVLTDAKAIEDAAARTEAMSKAATYAEVALGYLGAQFIEATLAAGKFAVDIGPLYKDMKLLGMSAEELAALQNQNIQGIKGAGISLYDFDDRLKSGAFDLLQFTGSLPEGAKLTAGLFHSFRMLSNQTDKELSASLKQSATIFKEMHDTVGTTAEQFQHLTQALESNQDIQVNMYRLNSTERAQTLTRLQQQNQELRNLGLMDDEAKSVIATFAELGAEGPKERRKKAAQLMAVGGALGMGSQARQLATMIQAGDTSSPEFVRLSQEIQKRAQAQYANVKGTAGEFAQYELTNKIPQLLGQRGPIAALATRQGMAVGAAEQAKAVQHATGATVNGVPQPTWTEKARDVLIKSVTGIEGILRGLFGTGLAGVIGTVWAFFKGKAFLSRMLGAGGAVTEGGVTLGGGVAAGGVAATAATVGSVIAAVASTGTALYSLVQAVRGKDASNWVSELDKKYLDLGGMMTNALSAVFGPKVTSPDTFRNYSKDSQVADMLEKYKADQAKGDQADMKDLMEKMDALVTTMAIADKRDPAKAVENLHKTIKDQHQETKQMTQEQTDVIKKGKEARLIKSGPVGATT